MEMLYFGFKSDIPPFTLDCLPVTPSFASGCLTPLPVCSYPERAETRTFWDSANMSPWWVPLSESHRNLPTLTVRTMQGSFRVYLVLLHCKMGRRWLPGGSCCEVRLESGPNFRLRTRGSQRVTKGGAWTSVWCQVILGGMWNTFLFSYLCLILMYIRAKYKWHFMS